jgi:hypothetical protein
LEVALDRKVAQILKCQFSLAPLLVLLASVVLNSCSMDSGFEAGSAKSGLSRPSFLSKKDFGTFDFSKECGLPADKMDDPNAILLQGNFTSLPITITGSQMGVQYSVTTRAKLSLSATSSKATQTISVEVVDTKAVPPQATNIIGLLVGAFAPGVVKNKAQSAASGKSGTSTSEAMPQKDWLKLTDGSNPEFKDLLCAGQGSGRSSKQEGGSAVQVTFSPALINAVSPLAPIERLRKEIGDGRSFAVTAAVSGGGKDYAQGSVSGRVSVREISPNLASEESCQGANRNADIAYEFTNEFPGGASKVGLPKRLAMYIDTKNKQLVAIINQDDKIDPELKKSLPPVCLVRD